MTSAKETDHEGPLMVRPPEGSEHYRRQLEAVTDNATLALFIMDHRQHCTFMNPAAERMTGYTLAEVQGRPLHDVVHHTRPDGTVYPLSECPIDQAFPQNVREQGEEVFVHRDGHFYPVAFTASPVLDEGAPVGTVLEVRPIREERQARREAGLAAAIGTALTQGGPLQDVLQTCSEAVVEHMEAASARIWTVDNGDQVLELRASAGIHTRVDGEPLRIPLGESRIGQVAQDRAPHLTNDVPNDPRISEPEWARREGIVAFAGYPLLLEDRTVGVLAMFSRHPLPESTLAALGAVADGIALAIDRDRSLRELERERARLSSMFQKAPAFITMLRGPDHVFEMANPLYYQLVGHRELVGRTVRAALPEIEGQGFFELLDRVYATGEPYVGTEVSVQVQREPGAELEERFVNFVYQPLAGASGDTTGILVHGVDVTEMVLARRNAEEHAEQAERARAVTDAFYEAAPIPAALVDAELRFRRINRALADFYGLDPAEVLGRSIREIAVAYADQVEPYYRQVLDTGEPITNVEVTIPAGARGEEERHFLVNYFPVRVPEGGVFAVGLVALEVTERRQVEAAQRQQAAMVETIQRVGRTVASELDLESIVQEVIDAATALTGAELGAFDFDAAFPDQSVVRSDDITADPRYERRPPRHGLPETDRPVVSYMAVPVISRTGEILGGLAFGHSLPGRFQDRHERLAEGVAGWAAVAMENAQLYRAEREARSEAERANRVKSEFLATMSHELRTPLNAMIGYGDLLLEGIPVRLPEAAEEKVERIGISARHLLELIDEILSFSRLEAGQERLQIDDVDVSAIMREVEALMEPLALDKGLAFAARAPDHPTGMRSDARKIRQILINLTGNAIKFTEDGEVELSVQREGDEVVFRVRDTGPGIADDHIERVFEPFWQVEGGATRTAGGTGLGLSVSRRLARFLGGDVSIETRVGEGSTFLVRLPLDATAASPNIG